MVTAIGELLLDTNSPKFKGLTDRNTEDKLKARVCKVPKPDLSLRIEDYPNHVKMQLKEKKLTAQDLMPVRSRCGVTLNMTVGFQLLCGARTEERLKELLTMMDLEYEIKDVKGAVVLMVNLSINTNMRISLMAMGNDNVQARGRVISDAFNHLKLLITGEY